MLKGKAEILNSGAKKHFVTIRVKIILGAMPRKQPLLVTTDLLEMLIDNYRYFLFSEHDFKNICFYLGDNILPLTVTCDWLISG